jgi:hypothetical protein
MKRNLFFFGLISVALVMFLTGCANPANGNDGVDKTALGVAIANAQAERQGVAINTAPLGTKWVTQDAWNALGAAINNASGVNADGSATQSQVDSATAELNSAIATFRTAKQDGTALPVDKSALITKLTEAAIAKDRAAQADEARDVAQGAPWARPAQHTALAAAITAAETVRDNTAATQAIVDTAKSALESAITAFTTAVTNNGTGTKTENFSQTDFDKLIELANAAKVGVDSSENGYDVPPDRMWVSPSVLKALNDAIDDAPAGISDTAYLAFSNALNTFNSAKQAGVTPDKAALFDALGSADTARTGVVIAANKGEAPSGSAWVTQTQWDTLATAYAASLTAANDSNATKNAVDTAKTNLETATATFSATKTANGLGTAAKRVTITGLPAALNGAKIEVGLRRSGSGGGNDNIGGEGTIQNSTATVSLFDNSTGNPWAETGDWSVSFLIEEANKVYFTKTTKSFSSATVTVTVAECGEMGYFTNGTLEEHRGTWKNGNSILVIEASQLTINGAGWNDTFLIRTTLRYSDGSTGYNFSSYGIDCKLQDGNLIIFEGSGPSVFHGTWTRDNSVTKTVAINGLSAVYKDGVEVMVGLFNTNDPDEGWDWEEESFPSKGTGIVTNGSLTVNLDGAGTGSSSYYVVFTAHKSGYLSFVSKNTIAFNSGSVIKAYTDFDLPVVDVNLEGLGGTPGMTVDQFCIAASQTLNRYNASNYEEFKTAMKTEKQEQLVELGQYAHSDFLDPAFFKDKARTQPFAGTDTIPANMVAYIKKPFTDERGRMELEGRL